MLIYKNTDAGFIPASVFLLNICVFSLQNYSQSEDIVLHRKLALAAEFLGQIQNALRAVSMPFDTGLRKLIYWVKRDRADIRIFNGKQELIPGIFQ